MPLISEHYHKQKLKEYQVNIKTKYLVEGKILERNTNNSLNDDITKGIICEKQYYYQDQLIHTEKIFDSRIEYTYISKTEEQQDYTCPNCGAHSQLKNFIDGCPYCGTYYNIDYTNKDLGSKYHYDLVLKNNKYRLITLVVDIIFSIIASFILIKTTSRTFNNIDIIKILIYGGILTLILYYFFYILDAYIILYPIKKYKENQNQQQINFWTRANLNKQTFYNNFHYELRKYYYNQPFIIDYDILDYTHFQEFKKEGNLYINVTADIRIISFQNNKIKSKITSQTYTLKHNKDTLILHSGTNIIKCPNCGASIDAIKGICEYCNTRINYFQEWILDNNQ